MQTISIRAYSEMISQCRFMYLQTHLNKCERKWAKRLSEMKNKLGIEYMIVDSFSKFK